MTDEESTFLMIFFRRFFLCHPSGHNAAGSRIFFITFFACAKKVTKESTPREGIPSGSLLPLRGGGIGFMGAASDTMVFAPGAVRSERLYRAFAKLCGLHWVSPCRSPQAIEAARACAPLVKSGGRQPIGARRVQRYECRMQSYEFRVAEHFRFRGNGGNFRSLCADLKKSI